MQKEEQMVSKQEEEEGEDMQQMEAQEKLLGLFHRDVIRNILENSRNGKQTNFQMENPTGDELNAIIHLWQQWPQKSKKSSFNLHIFKPEQPKQYYAMYFRCTPSIKLYIDKEFIENKEGFQIMEGEEQFEGTEDFMSIRGPNSNYIGEVKNRKPHGKGKISAIKRGQSYDYVGSFENGLRHGTGREESPRFITYVGEFVNDEKHGEGEEFQLKRRRNRHGETNLVQKAHYKGGWVDGLKEGFGIEETVNGTYEGDWKEGYRWGKGKMTYSKNKDVYEGEWVENMYDGQGTYHESEGNVYEGQFKLGMKHGEGTMTYENGDKYTGSWENGKKHGTGEYNWEDGDYYEGEWVKDSAEGEGKSWMNNQFFEGHFKLGVREGEGDLTNEEGDLYKGVWTKGQLVKYLMKNGQLIEEEEENDA